MREFAMPMPAHWWAAHAQGWGFCAAGWSGDLDAHMLVLARTSWDGTTQELVWPHPLERTVRIAFAPDAPELKNAGVCFNDLRMRLMGGRRVLFEMPAEDWVLLHRVNTRPISRRVLPVLNGVFPHELVADGASWLPRAAVSLACAEKHVWVLSRYSNQMVLRWYGNDGYQWSGHIAQELQAAVEKPYEPIPMVAVRCHAVVACRNRLCVYWSLGLFNSYEFEQRITSLAARDFGRRAGIAVGFESGLALHWFGADEVQMVDEGIRKPWLHSPKAVRSWPWASSRAAFAL